MGEVAMGEVKLSNRIRQNSEAAPWVVDAVKLLEAERDALLAEVAKLTDKALRYDLDQLGISQREREAVELVDLRAEVAKLTAQERIARALERIADALEKKP